MLMPTLLNKLEEKWYRVEPNTCYITDFLGSWLNNSEIIEDSIMIYGMMLGISMVYKFPI